MDRESIIQIMVARTQLSVCAFWVIASTNLYTMILLYLRQRTIQAANEGMATMCSWL